MPDKIAAILAAGRGTRLAGTGHEAPKGFLRLGDKPIVEESILRLQACGYDQVWIVTGHRAEFYDGLIERYPSFLRSVHNEYFASTGSFYSLCCLKGHITQSFTLLESDLIYEPRALHVLDRSMHHNAVLMSGFTKSGDEVYVQTAARNGANWLENMSKNSARLSAAPAGEFVGINKISFDLFAYMCALLEQGGEEARRYDYETDGLVASTAHHDIACVGVPDLIWAEIDDAAHLKRAQDNIYPRILAASKSFS